MPQDMHISTWKREVINMDFNKGLPRNRTQHDSIWLIIDKVTEFARFLPVKTTDFSEGLCQDLH